MDFIATITNSPYYFWQTELLIQSFKHHKMEDKLVIAICHNENKVFLPPNTQNHQRKFVFAPHDENNLVINKLFAIYAALHEKVISPNFASIHPDMVLMNPKLDFEDNVVFHSPEEDKELKDKLCPYPDAPWITVDGVGIFNDVPLNFFLHAIQNAKDLAGQIPEKKLGIAAWAKTMYQFIELMSYYGTCLEIEMNQHSVEAPFIHYRHGNPPYFSKFNYKYYGILDIADDPYGILVKNNPTSTTDYIRNLVNEYLEGQK